MEPYNVNSFRMKLSCSRCRERKLKCDREEPECQRCRASNVQCRYPERRKPRGTRQKTEIDHLGHRLEALEEQIASRPSQSQSIALNAPDTAPKHANPRTETAPLPSESEKSTTWIYRLVSGAKDNIEDLTSKGHLISDPPSPWAQSTVNNAINRLDTALAHLADPSPRPETSSTDAAKVNLSTSEILRYLDTFINGIVCCLTICDSFKAIIDWDFLRAMPHIIDSPFAQVSPAMRIIYYNAIYLAQSMGSELEVKLATRTYYKCLQMVPTWLESAERSPLDLFAANLTAWAAVNNFDYHLAWEFHREACRFGDMLGVHDVDLPASDSQLKETTKENYRHLHWTLVETDFLFRLWYEKPTALRCSPTRVAFPSPISPQKEQPRPARCILLIVWARVVYILAEFFEITEGMGSEIPIEVQGKIEFFCEQVEELIDDWGLLSRAKSPKTDPMQTWIYVDSVIAFYSSIIFMRRRSRSSDQVAHPQAVNASRTVIKVLLEWTDKATTPSNQVIQGFNTHLLTFYPFCAFFTLYYHILSATNPSEYEDDIRLLEAAVSTLKEKARVRPDFVPLVDALGALNDISRAVHCTRNPLLGVGLTICHSTSGQQERQLMPEQDPQQALDQVQFPPAQPFAPFESLQNLSSDFSLQAADAVGDPFGIPFQLQNQVTLNVGPPEDDPSSTNPDIIRTISQPADVVRAIENELIWRNWHESWWNLQSANDTAGYTALK
ncbi:hypothetical protein BJX63DRAFT_55798 [Aspergillus granulosus]|uniref:Zn(2)-C6 fungal-type domain-containing protein n=1 Tax=Aspergillus granulosus TaxID=176169 RepID=A0ABR4GXM6_9EURO